MRTIRPKKKRRYCLLKVALLLLILGNTHVCATIVLRLTCQVRYRAHPKLKEGEKRAHHPYTRSPCNRSPRRAASGVPCCLALRCLSCNMHERGWPIGVKAGEMRMEDPTGYGANPAEPDTRYIIRHFSLFFFFFLGRDKHGWYTTEKKKHCFLAHRVKKLEGQEILQTRGGHFCHNDETVTQTRKI